MAITGLGCGPQSRLDGERGGADTTDGQEKSKDATTSWPEGSLPCNTGLGVSGQDKEETLACVALTEGHGSGA